ncbi:PREDICTED: uncharacterized protein LOC104603096 [Nelumbo nucifera]|uniref:Uncharacterized protein LOC104603096 n=2 Tax=Nelumbo nucifera TaxID=4432 RepID=A0A1U8ACY8_NELNU|nr:PREDICTED: uncharacterized protein LOC104603096 [Nelumbo nucifera]DAD31630.1 TPA_asm: hypothetical protein HUJ06_010481 [Nelumbo nucifera]
MEDADILAADCVVICCCCPCLIIQLIVFVLLKLPYKLAQKSQRFARRKLGKTKWRKKITGGDPYRQVLRRIVEANSSSIQVMGVPVPLNHHHRQHGCGCSMAEIDKVFEELSLQGEFGFGSFWGRKQESGNFSPKLGQDQDQKEYENVVRYHFIQVINPLKYLS